MPDLIRLLAALAALLVSAAASAQEFSPDGPWVHPRLTADRVSVAPGETFHIALHQDIAPGWHTYWRNPGDSGLPTEIDLTLPEGWTAGDIVWPAPKSLSARAADQLRLLQRRHPARAGHRPG